MRSLAILVASAVLAVAGVASAESLEGKTLTVTAPGNRAIPIKIGDGYESGVFVAVPENGRHRNLSYPVTVANGEAWLDAVDMPKGPQALKVVRPESNGQPLAVRLVKRDNEDAIDVYLGKDLFTTYHYSNDDRKPYLWPVKAEGDVSVTRDWPMGEKALSEDHPHHVSFWTGYGDINGNDYWEYGERTGWEHTESIDYGSGNALGWIGTHIVWQDKDHNPVIDEHRTYRFFMSPKDSGERLFDVDVRFTASYGEVKFGDTKEGGMVSVRMADNLRERGGRGTITTSEGIVGGEKAWGTPAAWCDYSGVIEGAGTRGIAVFDSPSSFRYPTHWHVRDYGLMGANAFGYSHFYDGTKNGDHTVENGGTLSFSYRIYVHSGDVEEAKVAEHYADFANPPAVTVK